jgi:hypothetical protein
MPSSLTATSKQAGQKKRAWQTQHKLTDSRSMPAHNAGVPLERAVPVGTARRKHNRNVCQRLTHTLQTQRAKKNTPSWPAAHRREALQAYTTPTGHKHHSIQGITHLGRAFCLCATTLQFTTPILCEKSIAILGDIFDHFFL